MHTRTNIEFAMDLWHYSSRIWAVKGWMLAWAVRCRLEPMKKTAATIKKYLWGIINAESINSESSK